MKRLLATLLVSALVFALLPGAALAADAYITVGGVDLGGGTAGNYYWKNGDTESSGPTGSASEWNAYFNANALTLTLKDADIKGAILNDTSAINGYSCGIQCFATALTITLEGANTVTSDVSSSQGSIAIFCGFKLTINGSGSLVAQSTVPGAENRGIRSSSSGVYIEGGVTVTAIAGEATGTKGNSGIYGPSINIKNSTVTATGGSSPNSSYGLECGSWLGKITIDNSTVTANTTSTTGTKRAAMNQAPVLTGAQAQGSTASDGSNPVPYVAASNDTYMWVKTVPEKAVAFSSLTANGSDTETTTELTLTFDKDVPELTTDSITLTGATKGTLTKVDGTTGQYKLTIPNITVASGQNVTVDVAEFGYAFTPASKTVAVYVSQPTVPTITIAPNATFPQGNSGGDRTVTVGHGTSLAPGDIGEVAMDGTPLAESTEYTKASGGSVDITLLAAYLNTLPPGTHTLSIAITTGVYAGQTPSIQIIVTAPGGASGDVGPDIPETGDGATPLLWLGLLILAGAGLLATRRRRRA